VQHQCPLNPTVFNAIDKEVIMKTKLVLSICAAVPAIVAVVFASIPELVTLAAFPEAQGYALEIGVTLRYALASVVLMVAIVIFSVRNIEAINDQRAILMGCTIAFAFMCTTIIALSVFRGIPLQLPPMAATAFVVVLCLRTRSKLEPTFSVL